MNTKEITLPISPPKRLRQSAFIEILTFYGIAMIVDYLFFDGTRFRDIQPHPFWLPVILIAAQYGLREGIISAAIASILLTVGNLPAHSLLTDKYTYLFAVTWQPMLWFIVSLLIGAMRTRHINERSNLITQLEQIKEQHQNTQNSFKQLEHTKHILDARIASQISTASMAFHSARKLYQMDDNKVLANLSELVKTILSASKFSIYLLKDAQLTTITEYGWHDSDNYCKLFSTDNELFSQVIEQRNILCISHPDDQRTLADEGILAGPLYNADTEQLVGMLKIEQLNFLDFNINTLENFRTLCDWIGTTLTDRKVDITTSLQPQSNLRKFEELQFQAQFLYQLSQRINFEVSVIILQLLHFDHDTDNLAAVTLAMSRALFELRGTDTVFSYGKEQDIYIMFLPHTPLEHAKIVVEKFEPKFRHLLPSQLKDVALRATTEKLTESIYQT